MDEVDFDMEGSYYGNEDIKEVRYYFPPGTKFGDNYWYVAEALIAKLVWKIDEVNTYSKPFIIIKEKFL